MFCCLQIRHEVSFKTVTHKICSDACFNVYRRANGLIMNCCEQCGDYLPSRASANHSLLVDGQQKRFCCQNCIREYKQVSQWESFCFIQWILGHHGAALMARTLRNFNLSVVITDKQEAVLISSWSILFLEILKNGTKRSINVNVKMAVNTLSHCRLIQCAVCVLHF